MRSRGFFGRIVDAIRSAFTGEELPPEAPVEEPIQAGPFVPEEAEYEEEFVEEEPYYPAPEPEYEEVFPEPGSTPFTSTAEEEFIYLSSEYEIQTDDYAQNLLWEGWFDPDMDFAQRQEARELFFMYMEIESEDFDWDDWRDWYSSTSG